MQKVGIMLRSLWEKGLVAVLVLYTLLPVSPLKMPYASSDSGVFLYIGWRILNGELPYRDIWDHKPPLIFYLNALGLAFSESSRWGVWLLEFIAVFSAAWISYIIIKKAMGRLPAFFSLALWILTLFFVLDGGNLPEEFVLPLQFGCLWLILRAENQDKNQWGNFFVIGLLTGLAFFFKQTSIGMGLAIVLYLLATRLTTRRFSLLAKELLWIAVGILSIVVPVVIFFAAQGELWTFLDAVFRYNVIYSLSNASLLSHLIPIMNGISPLVTVGLFQLGLVGYGIAIFLLVSKNSLVKAWQPLVIVCLINLPVELLLVSTSGNLFLHYYMGLIPALSVFAALVCWLVLSQLAQWGMSRRWQAVFIFATIFVLVWSSFGTFQTTAREYAETPYETVIPFITANTSPDDTVLLWGAEAALNFYTRRPSPSRYVYQLPLYKINHTSEEKILAFLNEVLKSRPKYIFDTKNKGAPLFEFPVQTKAIQQAIKSVQARYQKVDNFGLWRVYQNQEP